MQQTTRMCGCRLLTMLRGPPLWIAGEGLNHLEEGCCIKLTRGRHIPPPSPFGGHSHRIPQGMVLDVCKIINLGEKMIP